MVRRWLKAEQDAGHIGEYSVRGAGRATIYRTDRTKYYAESPMEVLEILHDLAGERAVARG